MLKKCVLFLLLALSSAGIATAQRLHAWASFDQATGILRLYASENTTSRPTVSPNFNKMIDDLVYGKTTEVPWTQDGIKDLIQFIEIDNTFSNISPISTKGWFRGLSQVKNISIRQMNLSMTKDMSHMFEGCTSLRSMTFNFEDVDILANLKHMEYMFSGCTSLNQVTIGYLDTHMVEDMRGLFAGCSNMKSVNLSQLETRSVQRMDSMFVDCSSLSQVNVDNFNTANVQSMKAMFKNCSGIDVLDLSKFNTQKVTDMSNMFQGCTKLHTVDLSNFSTQNVTDVSYMFRSCSALTSLDMSNFNFDKVTKSDYMLAQCSGLKRLILGSSTLPAGQLTFAKVGSPAQPCYLKVGEGFDKSVLGKFELRNEKVAFSYRWSGGYFNTVGMPMVRLWDNNCLIFFCGDPIMEEQSYIYTAAGNGWHDKRATVSRIMIDKSFEYARPTSTVLWFSETHATKIENLEYLHTDAVTDMSGMFYRSLFQNLDLSHFVTSNVTTMANMFAESKLLTTLDLSSFNTGNVQDMNGMFSGCEKLNDLKFNKQNFVTGNVTSMRSMFNNCQRLQILDVSGFNTAKVTDMAFMFANCLKVPGLDLSNFSTLNVQDASSMFYNCTALYMLQLGHNDFAHLLASKKQNMFYKVGEQNNCNLQVLMPGSNNRGFNLSVLGAYDQTGKCFNWLGGRFTAYAPHASLSGNTLTFSYRLPETSYDAIYRLPEADSEGIYETPKWCSRDITVTQVDFHSSFQQVKPKSLYCWFALSKLESVSNLRNLNASQVTDMRGMFAGTASLTQLDLGSLDTRSATNMSHMFNGSGIKKLMLHGVNTENVTDMSFMFFSCPNLEELDLISFNADKVVDLSYMFCEDFKLKRIAFGNFGGELAESMHKMFAHCTSLTSLDLSHIRAYSVTDMSYMFEGCENLVNLNLNNLSACNVSNLQAMFYNCRSLTELNLDLISTEFVTNMSQMFYNCESLTRLDFSGFEPESATNVANMLNGCTGLRELNMGFIDYKHITDSSKKANAFNGVGTASNPCTLIVDTSGPHAFDVGVLGSYLHDPSGVSSYKWLEGRFTLNDYLAKLEDGVLTFYKGQSTELSASNVYQALQPDSVTQTPLHKTWWGWGREAGNVKRVVFDPSFDTARPTTTAWWFSGMSQLTAIEGMQHLHTDSVTDMSYMFASCDAMETIGLETLNTSRVASMSHMFYDCDELKSLSIASFNTDQVTDMSSMFAENSNLRTLELGSHENKKVINMEKMFLNCDNLTSLDLSQFGASSVWNMSAMFCGCYSITSLDFSKFNTQAARDMSYMFDGCENLNRLTNTQWLLTMSVSNMAGMFRSCRNLAEVNLGSFYTHQVTDMSSMFEECSSLKSLNLERFATSKLRKISKMLRGCVSLRQLNLGNNDFKHIADEDKDRAFEGVGNVNAPCALTVGDAFDKSVLSFPPYLGCRFWLYGAFTIADDSQPVALFNGSTLTFFGSFPSGQKFTQSYALTPAANGQPEWFGQRGEVRNVVFDPSFDTARPVSTAWWFSGMDLSSGFQGMQYLHTDSVRDMSHMFDGCKATNLDVSHFDTREVRNMSYMFSNCTVSSIDLTPFVTSNVTSMSGMFTLSDLKVISIAGFDTEQVTDMSNMFDGCEQLQLIDIGKHENKSLTNTQEMFAGCTSLTGLDLSNFGSSRLNNMAYMFQGCPKLTTLDLSGLDTRNVINMASAFQNCAALTSLDLSGFDTRNVTEASNLANGCTSLRELRLGSNDFMRMEASQKEHAFEGVGTVQEPCTLQVSEAFNMSALGTRYSSGFYYWLDGYFNAELSKGPAAILDAKGVLTFYGSQPSGTAQGQVYSLELSSGGVPEWNEQREQVNVISFHRSFKAVRPTSTHMWFNGMSNLTSIENLEYLCTDSVTSMGSMFNNCSSLTALDLHSFNTQNVTDMAFMFKGCESLTALDLSSFNTQRVTDMSRMFTSCASLESLDLSSFNTDEVRSMFGMFDGCERLTSLDLQHLNTRKVEDMSYMFRNCSALETLAHPNPFFITSEVKSMSHMFHNCSSLSELMPTVFDATKVTDMSYMFANCTSLRNFDIGDVETSEALVSMAHMFENCSSLPDNYLVNFNTQGVTDITALHKGCTSLRALDLGVNDFSHVANDKKADAFAGVGTPENPCDIEVDQAAAKPFNINVLGKVQRAANGRLYYHWLEGYFTRGTMTGIGEVNADGAHAPSGPAFNLNGQRVASDYRGIVIQNGQKILRK